MSSFMVVRTASGRASHLLAEWRPGLTRCGRAVAGDLPDAWRVDCRVCERSVVGWMQDELDARRERQHNVDAETRGDRGAL